MQVSQNELARSIGVSARRINEIVLGMRILVWQHATTIGNIEKGML